LKSQLRNARQPLDALKSVEQKVEAMEAKVEEPVERRKSKVEEQSSIENRKSVIRLGERVLVSTLNAEGVVTALGESDAEVQIGSLRVRARLVDLERKSESESKVESRKSVDLRPATFDAKPSPGMEVSLRGMMVEEALEALERYLEKAYLSGLPFVRIVHGKGTGKLRAAVRDALRGHEFVKSFEEGAPNEGGEGVTVALIAG
jgi:DNA mismatch repair protein MutS2